MALILDTGPLVALLDATDPDHARCAALLADTAERRIVPVCVLVEVEYLLRPWPRAFPALLRDIAAGAIQLLELSERWLGRVAELLERYADLPLGLVDATVIAAAEMLGEPRVVTLDQRHFSVVAPAHVGSLTLLP
jgi:predicted nucleic acid-binding protein